MNSYTLPVIRSGVYHLLRDGKVMYVGASRNLMCRIGGWLATEGIQIDEVRVFPVEPDRLQEVETAHIAEHDPPINTVGRKGQLPNFGSRAWRNGIVFADGCRNKVWFPSANAYLLTCPELLNKQHLVNAQIVGRGVRVDDLLRLASAGEFPAPIETRPNGYGRIALWRRSDILAHVQQIKPDAAVAA
jgi:hypothetical protein